MAETLRGRAAALPLEKAIFAQYAHRRKADQGSRSYPASD